MNDIFQMSDSPLRPRQLESEIGPDIAELDSSRMFDSERSKEASLALGFPEMEAVVKTEVYDLSRPEGREAYSALKTKSLRDVYGLKGSSKACWVQILWEDRQTTKDGRFLAAVSWSEYQTTEKPDLDVEGMSETEYAESSSGKNMLDPLTPPLESGGSLDASEEE
jgi:hypothetical protein